MLRTAMSVARTELIYPGFPISGLPEEKLVSEYESGLTELCCTTNHVVYGRNKLLLIFLLEGVA